jgi:hypothetical protein
MLSNAVTGAVDNGALSTIVHGSRQLHVRLSVQLLTMSLTHSYKL